MSELPFLVIAHFDCENCHSSIRAECNFHHADDWKDHPFQVRCACGWSGAIPGRKARATSITSWEQSA